MKYIEVSERRDRIKVSNDKTYQDVTIYPEIENDEKFNDLIVKLVINLLKDED